MDKGEAAAANFVRLRQGRGFRAVAVQEARRCGARSVRIYRHRRELEEAVQGIDRETPL